MNKDELLRELENKVNMGEISRAEIISRFSSVMPMEKGIKHFSVNKMLYVLGAAIVVIGVVIFAGQIWNDIGSLGRITITLGLGLLLTVIGSVLLKNKPEQNIGSVFHAIGGVLIPGGAIVTLLEFKVDFVSAWPLAITYGVIFAFYLLLNSIHKNVILTLFSIFNGTAFVYFLVTSMINGSFYSNGDIYAYLFMVIGLTYILLAHSFQDGWNNKIVDILYFLGSTIFLGATFSRVFDSTVWQMLYFFIVAGGLFFSVYIKSRNILIVSTIFLIVHVSYITGKYFADSLGWPVSLIVLGFIFIGLGYLSINLNKKYIKNN